jgi:hypothetical protein
VGDYFNSSSVAGARGQLHHAQFSAEPGLWQRQHHKREWIRVRAKSRTFVPCCCSARDAQDHADSAADQSVFHGSIGCESSRDVTADDSEDGAINRRKEQGKVVTHHGRAPRRKDMDCVKRNVGAKRENDDHDETGEQSADTFEVFPIHFFIGPMMAIYCRSSSVLRCLEVGR